AKVIDLSLAQRPGPTRRGVGTAQYLSPEQARGEPVGPPADVFGIGATLGAAAAAQRPFARRAPGGRFGPTARPAEPSHPRRRLPRALADVIDACLEPVPDQRPQVREVLRVCDALT